jgi:hypothetical protein
MHHSMPILEKFPKHEKFALTTNIKNQFYKILKLSINIQRYSSKLENLKILDIELEFLKELIVFSNEKKRNYLSSQSRKSIMEKLIEIGKITGGMIRKGQ